MLPTRYIFSRRRQGSTAITLPAHPRLSFELPVDDCQQRGRGDHPRELIPVEKRKAPQSWRRARVDLWKTEREVRQYKEQHPSAPALCRFGFRRRLRPHMLQSIIDLRSIREADVIG